MNIIGRLGPASPMLRQRLSCIWNIQQANSVSCGIYINQRYSNNFKQNYFTSTNKIKTDKGLLTSLNVTNNTTHNFSSLATESRLTSLQGVLSYQTPGSSSVGILQLPLSPSLQKFAPCSTNDLPKDENIDHKGLLQHLKTVPPAAQFLGYSGLVPFIIPTAYQLAVGCFSPPVAFIQLAYGATILSFLGGIRWGFCLGNDAKAPADWMNLIYSVFPSLIAWLGILSAPEFGITCLIGGLFLAGTLDANFKPYPPWFRALRVILSIGAILPLLMTFLFSIFLPSEEKDNSYNWVKLLKIIRIIVDD